MAPLEDIAIEPAVLKTIKRYIKDKDGNVIGEVENTTPLLLNEDTTPCTINVRFETALDHRKNQDFGFENLNIVLAATFVFGDVRQSEITTGDDLRTKLEQANKVTVFLCGGPGDQNLADRNKTFNDEYLKNKGCLIFLNYRGTGSFSEICYKIKPRNESDKSNLSTVKRYVNLVKSERSDRDLALANKPLSDQEANDMANLLTLFRQDSIVYDLESIRQCIGKDKWHIFGQSYGGWISLTYLSLFPESLESSTITAGLAPITVSCDDAYRKLFKEVKDRNDSYYKEYPKDIKKVKIIVKNLLEHEKRLKIKDGRLTARRFLCIGRNLGAREKFTTKLNELIAELYEAAISNFDLKSKQVQDALKLYEEEDSWKFDRRPLYAVLHEAMYCSDSASNWSAKRVASELTEFKWAGSDETGRRTLLGDICSKEDDDKHKIYFSGEMVYPFMFEDYDALKPLESVAEKLAQHEWTDPYNNAVLSGNQVPVKALSYNTDMHVNPDLSKATAALIGGIRHKVLNEVPGQVPGEEKFFQHASLRSDVKEVLDALKF